MWMVNVIPEDMVSTGQNPYSCKGNSCKCSQHKRLVYTSFQVVWKYFSLLDYMVGVAWNSPTTEKLMYLSLGVMCILD